MSDAQFAIIIFIVIIVNMINEWRVELIFNYLILSDFKLKGDKWFTLFVIQIVVQNSQQTLFFKINLI